MIPLEEKILVLGQSNKFESLTKYLTDISEAELLKLIKHRLTSATFIKTWGFILKGLSGSTPMKKKKYNLIIQTLKALDHGEIPSSQINDIVSQISSELEKYNTKQLVDFCNCSLDGLQNDKSNNLSWKELLPEVLNTLSESEVVHYNGAEIPGKEFVKQFVNTLCMLKWTPSRIIGITSMFSEISLNKDEHLQVVNKLTSYIEKLTPQEIPGFSFQLLKLCKNLNCKCLFMKFQVYFGLRIYEIIGININSENSDSMDSIESSSNQDLIEAESTVLYHIHSQAPFMLNSMKEYLLHLKNITKAPEYVLHPFQLTLLLTISTVEQYEDKVFEILKSCVSRYYSEIQKREESSWLNEMVPKLIDIEHIFSQILTLSLQDRDIVLQGLVKFAFVLLNIKMGLPTIFIDPIAAKQWTLGKFILTKIIRHKRHKAGIILQEIINNVLIDQNVSQYTECLYLLSRNLPLIMLENRCCVIEIIEDLHQLPGNTAVELLDSIIPLAKVSSTIRDHLILLLKKSLYSSKTDTRQMAVIGYVKLLTSLKISELNLSQVNLSLNSYSSGHSIFTQLSLTRSSQCSQNSFSNEALCLEILSVLRRCFLQKLEIRNKLYDGLYETVRQNIQMKVPILDVLWAHFSNYYIVDEETLPPLNFSKLSIIKDLDAIQQESLGKLIHVISLILIQNGNKNSDNEESVSLTEIKFQKALESVCERMINSELVHFELDDGSDLSDSLPESQQKIYILQETIRIYEALVAYKINSWNNDSGNNGQCIVALFQSYNRMIHFSKNIGKQKKDKRKKNDSDAPIQSMSRKDQKATFVFKVPETILDHFTLHKALQLLHEPVVEWTTIQEANVVKSKVDIHRHFLQCAQYLISTLKSKKSSDSEEHKNDFKHLVNFGRVIYNRCLKTLSNFTDFDGISAVLAVECFNMILNCVSSSHKKNILLFLRKIVDKENGCITVCLGEIIKVCQNLLEADEDSADDIEARKSSLIIVNILSILSTFIPSDSSSLLMEMYEWMKNYASEKTIRSKPVSMPFFTLLFSMQMRYKKDVKLLNEIIYSIGHILGTSIEIETDDKPEHYKVINELTAHNAYLCITNAIKTLLDEVDWVLARLKSELVISGHEDGNIQRKDGLLNKERGISCQLCFIATLLENLTTVAIQPGNLAEAIFKNICQFYGTLTNFTKYFNSISSKYHAAFQAARFEKLVKFVGKELSPNVNYIISFLDEESKKEQSSNIKSKKSVSSIKSKMLKDARSIPKVMYGMEQFSSSIIQLSNKVKIDLTKHVGQGTTRDFRIMVKELALPQDSNNEDDDCSEIRDEESENSEGQSETEEEPSESPPLKKSRKS